MKKRYRDITVDGIKYAWRVGCDYEGCGIRIWKDKKIIYNKYHFSLGDITPKFIAELIKNQQ